MKIKTKTWKPVTVDRPHITMPLCLCFHAAVCRRSSWLKGTKPHRNTWLGSVWPATARRAASAAGARESGWEGRLSGVRIQEKGRKWQRWQIKMVVIICKDGASSSGCWNTERKSSLIFKLTSTLPNSHLPPISFHLQPPALTLHPPATAPHLPSFPFWTVLWLL